MYFHIIIKNQFSTTAHSVNFVLSFFLQIWDRPDEDGKIKKLPTSVGQLLGKSNWEKPLADCSMATGVGL
jgi:hypothetical protein